MMTTQISDQNWDFIIYRNVHARCCKTSPGLCHSDGLDKHKKVHYHLYGKMHFKFEKNKVSKAFPMLYFPL